MEDNSFVLKRMVLNNICSFINEIFIMYFFIRYKDEIN